jgi:hypothetical protein
MVYPNPANDVINIVIDTKEASLFESSKPAPASYDIRLYDGQGIMRRKTNTVSKTTQFNVSDLPNGIYFIHVYDGVNSNPEIQKVLVTH